MKLNSFKKLSLWLLIIFMLVFTAGCKQRKTVSQLNYIADEEPASFNPYLSHSYTLQSLASLIFPGLFKRTSEGEVSPWLAEQIPTKSNGGISKDGLTFTYQLRKEAKWSDGTPVTSKDINFTWRFLKLLKGWGFKVDPDPELIENVKVLGDKKFKLILKEPYSPGVTEFFRWVFPAHILEKEENPILSAFWKKPLGAGPYRLVSWERYKKMVFEVNPNYWAKRPRLKRISVWFSRDEDKFKLFKQLSSPTIWEMVSDLNRPQLKKLREEYTYDQRPAYRLVVYAFNMASSPYDDLRLRKAVILSMPKKKVNEEYLRSEREFLYPQLVLPGQLGWSHKKIELPDNLGKARKLLEEAGYTVIGGLREKGGKKLQLELSATYFGNTLAAHEDEFNVDVYEDVLKLAWQKVGFQVRHQWSTTKFYSDYAAKGYLATGQHTLAYLTLPIPENGEFLPFASEEIPSLENISGRNIFFLSSGKIDELYEQYLKTYDEVERGRIWQKIYREFLVTYAGYPERYYPFRTAWKGNIKGFAPNPSHSGNFWNVEEWEVGE
jgi:peptide/nickel transport system substrate-binding protein